MMLKFLVLSHLFTGMELVYVRQPIQLQLDAKEMMSSLKSVLSSKFIQDVAHSIAKNAVEQFMQQINQTQALKNRFELSLPQRQGKQPEVSAVSVSSKVFNKPARPRLSPRLDRLHDKLKRNKPHQPEPAHPTVRPRKKKVLDQHIAYALLKTPAPDGDSLDLDSIDYTTTLKPVLKKINGRYMRRLLDYFNYEESSESVVDDI